MAILPSGTLATGGFDRLIRVSLVFSFVAPLMMMSHESLNLLLPHFLSFSSCLHVDDENHITVLQLYGDRELSHSSSVSSILLSPPHLDSVQCLLPLSNPSTGSSPSPSTVETLLSGSRDCSIKQWQRAGRLSETQPSSSSSSSSSSSHHQWTLNTTISAAHGKRGFFLFFLFCAEYFKLMSVR